MQGQMWVSIKYRQHLADRSQQIFGCNQIYSGGWASAKEKLIYKLLMVPVTVQTPVKYFVI